MSKEPPIMALSDEFVLRTFDTPRYGHEEGQDPDGPDDYWFDQRYEDALHAERAAAGRCGNCGAFDGPTHRCPPPA